MKQTFLIYLLGTILLVFNGCSEKIKYVYIKTPCPKLQTYELNLSNPLHFKINYRIRDTNESR